mgnify:CR=1 FL=1
MALLQLFRGSFYHCTGNHIRNVTTKAQCLANPDNAWQNKKYNFDDLGNALMSLFVLSSKDGWVMIMYQGLDAVGVDMQVSALLTRSNSRAREQCAAQLRSAVVTLDC